MMRTTPMKRTGFKRKAQAQAQVERAPRALYRLHRVCQPAQITGEVRAVPKTEVTRSESYRRLVAALPCAHCGLQGYSQAAHPNAGKAKGMKTDDTLCFPLCADRPGVQGCHSRFDQHQIFPRDQRASIEAQWARNTAEQIGKEHSR